MSGGATELTRFWAGVEVPVWRPGSETEVQSAIESGTIQVVLALLPRCAN